jgi:hypothetical protein
MSVVTNVFHVVFFFSFPARQVDVGIGEKNEQYSREQDDQKASCL